ncbi:MAG: hypothetical protein HY814_07425 [Candidatus Riflebacteria bacterium]|nr:hypothetical protein [Candidatus Riflebacteria bacterium]
MGRRPLEERPAAGFGLPLLLVLCILLILGTVGFHQLFWASHVTAGASRGAWGELALRAAESAVEELKHRVELDASDPERRLFHELRQDVPAGADGSFEVADSARLDVLPALLAEEVTPEMSLEKCSASVAYQIPFEDLPFERFGMMRYSARVAASGPGVSWVVRDLEIAQGFKVVLASVPRPFDQAAVYVGDAWSAVDLAQVNRLRDRHVQMATAQLVDLERAAALAPPPLQSRYAEARSSVSSVPEVAARVPRLAESKPAMLLAVGVGGQEYPLDGLALDRKLAAQEALVRPLVERPPPRWRRSSPIRRTSRPTRPSWPRSPIRSRGRSSSSTVCGRTAPRTGSSTMPPPSTRPLLPSTHVSA